MSPRPRRPICRTAAPEVRPPPTPRLPGAAEPPTPDLSRAGGRRGGADRPVGARGGGARPLRPRGGRGASARWRRRGGSPAFVGGGGGAGGDCGAGLEAAGAGESSPSPGVGRTNRGTTGNAGSSRPCAVLRSELLNREKKKVIVCSGRTSPNRSAYYNSLHVGACKIIVGLRFPY